MFASRGRASGQVQEWAAGSRDGRPTAGAAQPVALHGPDHAARPADSGARLGARPGEHDADSAGRVAVAAATARHGAAQQPARGGGRRGPRQGAVRPYRTPVARLARRLGDGAPAGRRARMAGRAAQRRLAHRGRRGVRVPGRPPAGGAAGRRPVDGRQGRGGTAVRRRAGGRRGLPAGHLGDFPLVGGGSYETTMLGAFSRRFVDEVEALHLRVRVVDVVGNSHERILDALKGARSTAYQRPMP